MGQICTCRPLLAGWLAWFVLASATGNRAAAQFHPDHPQVRAMVDRGVDFLRNSDAQLTQSPDGAVLLVGYTILKATGDDTDPKVLEAVAVAERLARSLGSLRAEGDSKIVYEVAVAAVLLSSIDAVKYSSEIRGFLGWFEQIQKSHGGFGYLNSATGDTSQVQYVMLALWSIEQAGIEVPVKMVENCLRYIKATMDPTGSWGYQGRVATNGLTGQTSMSKSLATAGVGALIIGGDLLGFYGARKQVGEDEDGIPKAFKRVDLLAERRARRRELSMSRADTDNVLAVAVRYQRNSGAQSTNWYYYWRYSQERYESFLEIVEARQEKSPGWYNQGVNELAEIQENDGSWGKSKQRGISTTPSVDTCFAVLFLIRSTQKAIGKINEGVTFGGYELPNDVGNIKMVGNRIVSAAEASVDSLLEMLESNGEQVQVGLLPEHLQLSSDPTTKREQVQRLSRLIRSRDYKARRVAARLLGRSEDLDQVPDLIYALTDDDPEVPVIAEESLRLLSRKLRSGDLTPQATPEQKTAAVKFWKEWYLGLRPDYVFVDE